MHIFINYKKINKGKTPNNKTREYKKTDWSPNKISHSKVQNVQQRALRGENMKPRTWTHHH